MATPALATHVPTPSPLVARGGNRGTPLDIVANWTDCPSLAWAAKFFMDGPLGPNMRVTVYAFEVCAPPTPRDVAVVSLEVRVHSIGATAVLRRAPVRTTEHLEWLRRTLVPAREGRLIGFWFDATTSELRPAVGPRGTHQGSMADHGEAWTWVPDAVVSDSMLTCVDIFCGIGT